MKLYRVWLRSTPGFFAQYDVNTEVLADDEDDAIDRAIQKLQRTSFPDRSRSMWSIEKVERVFR